MLDIFVKGLREYNDVVDIRANIVAEALQNAIELALDVLNAAVVAYYYDLKEFLALVAIDRKLLPILSSDKLLVEEGDRVDYTNKVIAAQVRD